MATTLDIELLKNFTQTTPEDVDKLIVQNAPNEALYIPVASAAFRTILLKVPGLLRSKLSSAAVAELNKDVERGLLLLPVQHQSILSPLKTLINKFSSPTSPFSSSQQAAFKRELSAYLTSALQNINNQLVAIVSDHKFRTQTENLEVAKQFHDLLSAAVAGDTTAEEQISTIVALIKDLENREDKPEALLEKLTKHLDLLHSIVSGREILLQQMESLDEPSDNAFKDYVTHPLNVAEVRGNLELLVKQNRSVIDSTTIIHGKSFVTTEEFPPQLNGNILRNLYDRTPVRDKCIVDALLVGNLKLFNRLTTSVSKPITDLTYHPDEAHENIFNSIVTIQDIIDALDDNNPAKVTVGDAPDHRSDLRLLISRKFKHVLSEAVYRMLTTDDIYSFVSRPYIVKREDPSVRASELKKVADREKERVETERTNLISSIMKELQAREEEIKKQQALQKPKETNSKRESKDDKNK